MPPVGPAYTAFMTFSTAVEPRVDLPSANRAAAEFLIGFGGNSYAAYKTDLRKWFEFCAACDVDPFAARRVHVDAFKAHLDSLGLKAATLARKISVVRNFYKHCVSEGYVRVTPVPEKNKKLHIPPVPQVSSTPSPGTQEVTAIIATAKSRSLREYAIIRFLAHQAVRVSELCGLDLADVRVEAGHRVVLLKRKGGGVQLMPLAPDVVEALDDYLAARGSAPGPLFLDRKGARMTRFQVAYLIEVVCRAAGAKVYSPHGFRHACATYLIRVAKLDIDKVKGLLGHVSVTTTQRYFRAVQQLDESAAYATTGAFG